MNQTLQNFCSSVRNSPSSALEALLKIAETKDAMLRWWHEAAKVATHGEPEHDLMPVAIAHALAKVDLAEELILEAFHLSSSVGPDLPK